MTRSAEIVNTSNGDGEDLKISAGDGTSGNMYGPLGSMHTGDDGSICMILQPGQSGGINVYEGPDDEDGNHTYPEVPFTAQAVRRMEKVPNEDGGGAPVQVDRAFVMNGKQVTPFVTVGFH